MQGNLHGNCIEYYKNGEIRFDGCFKNGLFEGKGVEFYSNG